MSKLDEFDELPRRKMTLIFLIDKSGSMSGTKISTLNVAVQEILPTLRDIAADNVEAEIHVAALEYSTVAEWMYDSPQNAEQFQWRDVQAGGLTSMGAAFAKLEEKLHKETGFMKSATGSFAPVFIHLSDGEPTDDYASGLAKLKSNSWFRYGIKIAIAIGHDANKQILCDFTGTPEAVLTVHNKEDLKALIQFVTITSSKVGSSHNSNPDGNSDKQQELNEKIKDQIEGDPNNHIELGVDLDPNATAWPDDWD